MAATMNMFSALDSDDEDTPIQKTQPVKTDKAPAASEKAKGRGKGKNNRSKGKGKGRGRGDRDYVPRNSNRDNEDGAGEGKGKSARETNRRNRSKGKGTGRGRGSGRVYERRDGTGRGREGAKKDGAGPGNWGTTDDQIAEGVAEVTADKNVENEAGEETPVEEPAVVEEVDNSVGLDEYFTNVKVSDNSDNIRKVDATIFDSLKNVKKGEEADFLNMGGGKKKKARDRKGGATQLTELGFKQPAVSDDFGSDRRSKGKGDRKGKGKGKGKRDNRGNRGAAIPNLKDDSAFPSLGGK